MSSFLGPIHYKVYEKVGNLEEIVEEILLYTEENMWNDNLRTRLNENIGEIERDSLEKVIDENNIHSWLDERVKRVDKRLAFAISEIINEDEDRDGDILELAKKLGGQLEGERDLEAIFNQIEDTFVDGMPCDFVNTVLINNGDILSWKTLDIRSRYWVYGLASDFYYEFRDSFIEGLLENYPDVKYRRNGQEYTLERV